MLAVILSKTDTMTVVILMLTIAASSVVMPSIAISFVMPSVIMVGVTRLNVVAPTQTSFEILVEV